ncbi:MAG: MoaD/ThiS family protein [Deltaproteobacteria bacterium]|nr:MoaD/ThiS family protein [Deltaproteobacteria bacterium]
MKIKVRLFGAFRNYGNGSLLEVELDPGATVAALREALRVHVKEPRLLSDSAFADETAVLIDAQVLRDGTTVAVLPPVCGG